METVGISRASGPVGSAPEIPRADSAESCSLPLFRFGPSGARDNPLTIVSGALILDQGEAERTFIYRCQDRFLTYAGLMQWPSLFLAGSERHVAFYRERIATLLLRFEEAACRTGVLSSGKPREPLFVLADVDDLRIRLPSTFDSQLADARLLAAASAGVALNQVSPTYARLVGELERLLGGRGVAVNWDAHECRRMSRTAMRWHDKTAYWHLVQESHGALRALHVTTAVLTDCEFDALSGWDELVARFAERTGEPAPTRLFVKSSRNSAGNLAAAVDASSFPTAYERLRTARAVECFPDATLGREIASLRAELEETPCLQPLGLDDACLARLLRLQAGERQHLDILVQPVVSAPSGDGRFAGLGLSFFIKADGTVAPIAVSAQIYRDPERKHFLGAFISDEIERQLPPAFLASVRSLCGVFANEGYKGPISFDARLSSDGTYRLIYDCNPRLTGIFPSLALRAALRREALPADTVLTLGYRGEWIFPDLGAILARLDRVGVLYTRQRRRGAVVLPNLCRADGYDVHLVNVTPREADALLGPDGALAGLSHRTLHATQLHY